MLTKATIDDLKKEPFEWKEKMLYLNKKFEESRNKEDVDGPFYSGLEYFEALVEAQRQRNIVMDRANEEIIARLLNKSSFWKDYLAELVEDNKVEGEIE